MKRMLNQKRARDFGVVTGIMRPGRLNSITDVSGVTVGNVTLDEGPCKTGVTAILPHQGDLFHEKVFAACYIINGFGKSAGLIQVEELGTIETPIILTNTLSVGTAYDAVVRYMLEQNGDIGCTTGSVNPIVCECNDGEYLNDIRALNVKTEHIFKAIKNASAEFLEGSAGAGTGMSCYKMKGGIGTASRAVPLKDREYTLGALVMANQGEKRDLIIAGRHAGEELCKLENDHTMTGDKGSIIMIIATDIPLSEHQLKRLAKRSTAGLVRTGSYMGNGSGDIALAFSTANRVSHYEEASTTNISVLNSNEIDTVFRAASESIEEAILNSLFTAVTTTGKKGNTRRSIADYAQELRQVGII